ncbi:GNAT family N-acetyltransferase [Fontimonas sp. SYSU GA230001]|uniref:GNAT family N-acetyltransferase n=1 Tax=Fontimonas sp. SYSU GA230001 TaxID=3142450 RepID=UPI0032B54D6E
MAAMSAELYTSPAYLEALEAHGCVGPGTGWTPAHLRLAGGAHAPCYRKSHSWGEFVFDFAIARAYAARGLAYYPKLVCCVPFTPVPGRRLLADDESAAHALADALIEQVRHQAASGIHVLFSTAAEVQMLEARGWLPGQQLRYRWSNRGYVSFDHFLDALSAKRRKNIRRERRLVAALGLRIDWRTAATLSDDEWARVYALYANTYHERGQAPYLTLGCLRTWAERCGERMLLCTATRDADIVAMAYFFRDDETLYGRHWGSATRDELLHFELCYYQGIDHAIRHGLSHFDAGVQGDHKLLRGFEPVRDHSAHWFAHRGFHEAVGRYYAQERAALDARIAALAQHGAYRSPP